MQKYLQLQKCYSIITIVKKSKEKIKERGTKHENGSNHCGSTHTHTHTQVIF